MKIGILDYKACNLASVFYSIYNIGHDPVIIEKKTDFKKINKLIIPGVGSAKHCLDYLRNNDLISEIDKCKKKGMSILGICLGMQIFAKKLYEHGVSKGLDYIEGEITPLDINIKFNIGWSDVFFENQKSFYTLENRSSFFFCHSYYYKSTDIKNKNYIVGKINLNKEIPAVVIKENILGVQFHPEKSQENGVKFFNFFIERF